MRPSYQKTVLLFLAFLALYVVANGLIWKFATEELLTGRGYVAGDLARMGYVSGVTVKRKTLVDLPLRHVSGSEFIGRPVDMLTIGDSFSNGGGGGRNSYYQDYIASLNGLSVLNIQPYKKMDALSTIVALDNNGILDKIRPRYVLIEASQKGCVGDLSKEINFGFTLPADNREPFDSPNNYNLLPEVFFLNDGNFKYLLYRLLYHFSDHAFIGSVHVRKLKAPLFSAGKGDKLLFLRDDVKKVRQERPTQIALLNHNMNVLADRLAKKGIALYFMPCVDKYVLYSDYLANNPYPRSMFFRELRKLQRTYSLIDTELILAEQLKKGEKDLFYPDDTHWSWKASKLIFEKVRFN